MTRNATTTFQESTPEQGPVLVTGATGFVAGHVIADLIEHGYSVRGTVRNLGDTDSREHLSGFVRRGHASLDIVEADLIDDDCWDAAVAGCTAVIHIASPIPLRHKPTDFLSAAVDGTLRVLGAAARSSTTRRVVLTSSTSAADRGPVFNPVRSERDWSDPAACGPYELSKTLAERAAWDFVDVLPPDRRIELTTILPGAVLGPLLRPEMSVSLLPVHRLLAGTIPGAIHAGWPPVDVRDLATAHRRAMESPSAAGHRYICAGPQLWMPDIARILAEEFGPQGYPVPTRTLPNWAVRLLAVIDREARLAVSELDRVNRLSAEKIRSHLNMQFRPIETTILDTARSLIDLGLVTTVPNNERRHNLSPRLAGVRP